MARMNLPAVFLGGSLFFLLKKLKIPSGGSRNGNWRWLPEAEASWSFPLLFAMRIDGIRP